MAILIKTVRDNVGFMHAAGEKVTVVGRFARSHFDNTELIMVRFASNGCRGALMTDEIVEA
ncbi:MAG TPA: hypothetical protein VGY99_06460 [Candidatus Binataceae bacterium]|jgi:hypothetical protein|nr:hypothetical protein [Candidatus Binataceae bacterium]